MAEARRPCKKCGRNRAERFFTGPRGHTCSTCRRRRTRTGSRDQRLQETYGITHADYLRVLEAQGGVCAICRGARPGNLDVDHDHAEEKRLLADGVEPTLAARRSIRGLLCRRCNRRLLPAAQDSIERLESAISYLSMSAYGGTRAQRTLYQGELTDGS